MAKNKNRKQNGPQNRAAQSEQGAERAQRTTEEHEAPLAGATGSPSAAARKQQKRFGHN
ncbi:hypothetical protein KUM39_14925 [Streptomyces sp. J2-1]|uniref:hypothetical protein n=1 Tax=Streptomyces corallincola TaxID=2851888 RepID=UPI001C387D72|nr:hypothetical protein [Streptomyces corallincola]MBV2355650.1 hypothetical protein [Streptomyces corallincola]